MRSPLASTTIFQRPAGRVPAFVVSQGPMEVPSSGFVPVTVAPDGAVIIISPNTSTYSLTMYKNADGSVPVAFTGSGAAQAVAASATSLYVLGAVSGSADFNPGTKSDIQGTLPGIFVTRFSY